MINIKYEFRKYDDNKSLIENLLSYRSIPKNFFNSQGYIYKKEKLYGISEAIKRINLAIENKEKIGIFSDN